MKQTRRVIYAHGNFTVAVIRNETFDLSYQGSVIFSDDSLTNLFRRAFKLGGVYKLEAEDLIRLSAYREKIKRRVKKLPPEWTTARRKLQNAKTMLRLTRMRASRLKKSEKTWKRRVKYYEQRVRKETKIQGVSP